LAGSGQLVPPFRSPSFRSVLPRRAKQFRAIAIGYDKIARNFGAVFNLVAVDVLA
jgi:hypothetical protein